MAEPVRKFTAAAAPAPGRRRVALFADVLPGQPIAAPTPAPRRRRTLLEEIAAIAFLAGLVAFAALLWCA